MLVRIVLSCAIIFLDKIKLHAIHDFDPKQMSKREKRELSVTLQRARVTEQVGPEQRNMLDRIEKYQHRFERYEIKKNGDIEYDRKKSDFFRTYDDNENLKECSISMQHKQIKPENDLRVLKIKVYSRKEETSDIQEQEEAIKMKDLKTIIGQKELIMEQKDLQNTSHLEILSDAEETNSGAADSDWESDWESERESEWELVSCHGDESYVSEGELDLYAMALPFKRGDIMEGIPRENIRLAILSSSCF